jgi:predicted Zn-dependent protease
MSKRLAFLKNLVAEGKADSFARYAFALELKNAGLIDDAVVAFEQLRSLDPQYLPQYLMAGQMLIDAGRGEAAQDWLTVGIERATEQGDHHCVGELQSALANV